MNSFGLGADLVQKMSQKCQGAQSRQVNDANERHLSNWGLWTANLGHLLTESVVWATSIYDRGTGGC